VGLNRVLSANLEFLRPAREFTRDETPSPGGAGPPPSPPRGRGINTTTIAVLCRVTNVPQRKGLGKALTVATRPIPVPLHNNVIEFETPERCVVESVPHCHRAQPQSAHYLALRSRFAGVRNTACDSKLADAGRKSPRASAPRGWTVWPRPQLPLGGGARAGDDSCHQQL